MSSSTTKQASAGGDTQSLHKLHRSIVTVYVGPKQYPFYLHKGRLCQHSSFFEGAFHGSFKEATTGSMYLEEDGVEEFILFEDWLYSNQLIDPKESADPSLLLVKLVCLADRVGISNLQNATLDAIRNRATGQYTSPSTPTIADEIVPGMQGWKARQELNSLYGKVRDADFTIAKKQFFDDVKAENYGKNGESPTFVALELKHGSITVMNGKWMQKYYEHSVIPKGEMRYALTARYVKPENIDKSEHWKADDHIAPEDAYDGDLNIIQEMKQARAARTATALTTTNI